MLWVGILAGLVLGLALIGVWAVRENRKFNREIRPVMRAIQEVAERQNRYEFYKSSVSRDEFLLLYADMPDLIEREVGPQNWHSLLCHWGLPPTNAELWR